MMFVIDSFAASSWVAFNGHTQVWWQVIVGLCYGVLWNLLVCDWIKLYDMCNQCDVSCQGDRTSSG